MGKGTTLRLTLTLAHGDPADVEAMTITSVGGAPMSRPLPTREQARREGSLVLLVEDHPVNRTVLVSQLETIGFVADTAPDGQDGFDAWRSGDYALVLTDLNMPRMDGFELAREIRRHEREAEGGRVPILALTASVMQGEPEKCRVAGMDDFAAKPTTIPFLASKLRQWLPDVAWAAGDAAPVPAQQPPPPAASSAGAPIDPSVLEEMTGGDAALAAEVLDEFVTTTRADLDALSAACAAGAVGDVRRLAHRIKGAARAVGAPPTAELAHQIESLAALGGDDWARFEELRDELSGALEALVAVLARSQVDS